MPTAASTAASTAAVRRAAPLDLDAATAAARALHARLGVELAAAGPARLELVEVVPLGAFAVQHWRLGNGLRVLVAPDADAKVVAVHTWIGVGSAHEKAGKTGLAHLLEHLMFKSTRSRPAGTFDRVLEQLGASANAATWLDWTYYHEVVPPEHLAAVLELEADRLQHLDLTPAAFRAELDVVRNERREEVDNDPDGQVDEALFRAAYGDHVYGHPTIGWMADLDKLQLADVRDFYRQSYSPGRVALVLAGAVEPEAALREVVRFYGAIPAVAAAAVPAGKPVPQGPAEQTVEIDAGAERLAVAWRTVPGNHADHPALAVLAEILFNADSARLQRQLLYDAAVASSAEAAVLPLRHEALFDVRITLLPKQPAREALRLVEQGLADLRGARPPAEAELQAAKNRLRMEHYRELAAVDGRAEAIGLHLTSFGDLRAHGAWWQAVAGVTVADVQRVARTWLVAERRVVVFGQAAPERVTARRGARGKKT